MTWLSDQAVARLRSRYHLLDEIGRGGMGTVYLAEDTALNRRVAIKVLHVEDATGDLARRMLREACIIASLEHPGIVPVHDAGQLPDGRVYYTMKYVEGRRLDQLTAAPVTDQLRLFQKLCEAVAFAHSRGVIHRDLKPANVMVGPYGEVLVMDWGIAKVLAATDEASGTGTRTNTSGTGHGAVLGTPGYMAPEQEHGDVEAVTERSDVYALGAILHFLLQGESIPRRLAAISGKAMSHEPGNRYASAGELAADVAAYLNDRPVAAYPENAFERAGRFITRHQVWVILLLTYLVVRMILLVLLRP